MGEVYQARDTKLDRDVALKVLPDAFTSDPDRLARFEREAKVLASLNHPNIGSIYGLEEAEGVRALVLELIEGPTLADRVAQGAIPLNEALPIARQIAEALEAAHEAGVIHRDLKPANIKVREDGTVKVLDFGLAKAFQPDAGDASASMSPTISLTAAATQMGMVIGTAAYMAPEQAKGKVVDKRADVWAFGAVLYEMLTGQKPFVGDDVSTTLARVIEREPDWDALPNSLSPVLATYLRRCLTKEPKQRVHDIADVRLAMEGAFETGLPSSSARAAVPRLRSWQRPVPAAIGLLAAMAVSGLAVWSLTRPGPASQAQVTHFAVPVDGGHEMFFDECPRLALSPDGRVLAYVASGQLHLRRLDRLDTVAMAGTAGAESLFFSPDGRLLGFVQGGMLKSLSLDDGLITEITRVGSSNYDCVGASWGQDGTIVYRPAGARVLFSVPAVGGTPQPLTTIRDPAVETFHHWPQVIDGGQQVLFTIIGPDAGWGDAQVVVEDLDTGDRTTVVEQGTYGRYVPTGHVVYATASGTLFAVPYELGGGAPPGDRFPVVPGVRVAGWGGAASFAVSDAGTAAFVHGSNETRQLLWWVDREGRRVRQVGSALSSWVLRLSPDGRRVAVEAHQPVNGDIVLVDTDTGQPERLTFGGGFDQAPVWSPDGRRVAYATYGTDGNSAPRIDAQDVDTGGQAVTLYTEEAATDVWLADWSVDGWLAFFEAEGGNNDVYAVHVEDSEKRIDVAVSAGERGGPVFLAQRSLARIRLGRNRSPRDLRGVVS